MGDIGEVLMRDGGRPLVTIALSTLSATPFGDTGAAWTVLSAGGLGCAKMALPSSESASNKSGGRRSFSISDLRLY